MWALVVCSPLVFVALEAGWVAAELGRQPWIIYNVMRTSDGVTTNPGIGVFFFVFLAIYLALATATIGLLRRLARESKTFAVKEQVAGSVGIELADLTPSPSPTRRGEYACDRVARWSPMPSPPEGESLEGRERFAPAMTRSTQETPSRARRSGTSNSK